MTQEYKHKHKERKKFKEIFGFDAPIDKLSIITRKFKIDLFAFENMIPDYNSTKCEYKGKKDYSMSMAVEEHYGKEAMELVKSLI